MEKWTLRRQWIVSFPMLAAALSIVCVFLLTWDYGIKTRISTLYFDRFEKTLPWKSTFFPKRADYLALKNSLQEPEGEDELMLAESSFAAAAPIPWMQDGPEAVVFYAGQKRFKILRVPPIVGPTSADEILKNLPAYRKGMDEYRPEAAAVAELKNVRKKVEIEVWFGSWCPHCRAVVPRFLKTLQAVANTNLAVSFNGVPREFGAYAPSTARAVKGLPTFILTQGGKELGRVQGEPASGSLEAELARIVKQGVVAAGN